jgi:excinuclease UvrABC nuclease subunit
MLTQSLAFDPSNPEEALRQLPTRQAVFALHGENPEAEPYIGITPDLRRRLKRLLQPATGQTKRLQLVSRVRRIAWQETGSDFESLLVQFSLLEQVYGAKVLERMHLRAPSFVRFHGGNPYPRLTVTNRPNLRESQWFFGPFPSRASAEHYADELLKLFLLRRCPEDLDPNPAHPGCVYSEMKMCLAPCYQGCSDTRYAEEAESVRTFLATRGESKLAVLAQQRQKAAEDLEFESAAALHAQYQRVESVRALAPELVHPLSELRAVLFQPAPEPGQVSVFLYENGSFRGPAPFSTLGMRIQNEQSGSSSLFAQPMALEAIPERPSPEIPSPDGISEANPAANPELSPIAVKASRDLLESRLEIALATLTAPLAPPSPTTRQGHLALLARWYYRPQQKRSGEICFPSANEKDRTGWPVKAMLRSIGRVAAANLR